MDDGRCRPLVIEYGDDLFEPPPSWARRHPFAARVVALALAFALLAPIGALLGSRLGGDDQAVVVPDDVAALIEEVTTAAPDEEPLAVPDVAPTTLTISDGPAVATPLESAAAGADAAAIVTTEATVAAAPGTPAAAPPVATTRATVVTSRPTTTTPARATTTTTKAPATTTTTAKVPATTRPTPTTRPPTTAVPVRAYTPGELEAMVRAAFAADPDTAVQIVQRESGFNPGAHNGGCCYGLFQINWSSHRSWLSGIGITRPDLLYDATLNIKAATLVYLRAGGWGPWQ